MRTTFLSIRSRLLLSLGLIVAFLAALIVLSLFAMRRSHERAAETYSLSAARAWQANMIRETAHDLDNAILSALLAADDVTRSLCVVRIRTAIASARTVADDLEGMSLGVDANRSLADVRDRMGQARQATETVIRTLESGTPGEAQGIYQSNVRPAMDELRQSCALLVTQQEEQRSEDHAALGRLHNALWRLFAALGVLVSMTVIGLGILFTRSITRPIRQAVHMAERLAEGQSVEEPETRGPDEMAQLLRAMNLMAKRIGENRSLEHQLQQSQKLETVGRLAGGVAHDFNNLLTVITTYADLLGEEPCADEELVRESVAEIKRATMRAADLTRQLLAFSRKQVMEMKVLDVGSLLAESEKMLSRVIGEDIELRTKYDAKARVYADRGQLHQVIMNLAVNARDAMPKGGVLALETADCELGVRDASSYPGASAGRYVAIVVTDTGVGMSREVQEKMFEPFFTTKEAGRGTGLGLSTVYGIVTQSGGHIAVESAPGRGTTFRILLPSAVAEPNATEFDGVQPQRIEGNEEILVVEDEDQVRQPVVRMLRRYGYRARGARSGAEAMAILQGSGAAPALLLTDMVMPGMNGVQVADKVAQLRPGIRVLFMSGYTEHAVIDQHVLGDAANFIHKPFTVLDLARKVRHALDRGSPSQGAQRVGASAGVQPSLREGQSLFRA